MNAPHPAADLLRQYSVGQMSDESAGELERHLAECPQCEETLDNLAVSDETLISELRRPAVVDPVLEEPELRAALAQIVEHAAGVSEAAGESSNEAEGREIGVYRLLEELGSGGMGTVYKALHTRLEKEVALKILATERLKDPQAVSRFDREMKAVGKLEHPHIVRAYDAGELDGQHFLVTEYVKGCDLSQLSRKLGPLPIADACELARQAALGLEEAHEHGMVHRDIKPANLFLARQKGRPPMVKVLDLGLALIAGEHAPTDELTGTGQIMGTIDYMAPEQAGDTHNVDIRADVYSLGATLYRLLTGSSIYRSDKQQSVMQKLSALATQPAPPIQSRRADVPDELAAVVQRMLEKDPAGRYATPADVAKALEPFCAGHDLKALLKPRDAERTIADVDAAANSASVHDGSVETQDEVDPGLQPTLISTADHVGGAETVVRPRAAGRGWGRWLLGGVAVAALMLGVILIQTQDGTIRIETNQTDVEVLVDGEKTVYITDPNDKSKIVVKIPKGAKTLRVRKAGFVANTEKFELETVEGSVKVSFVPVDEPVVGRKPEGTAKPQAAGWKPTDKQKAFIDRVATLPAVEQVEAVRGKLKEVNPGFDGAVTHKIEAGAVVEFEFVTDEVTEIWPVRGLKQLQFLNCGGSAAGKGKLTDLSPLAGMPLDKLYFYYTEVSDISALRGMPCTQLAFQNAPVSDISALSEMPLEVLSCFGTKISDLSPLKQSVLWHLKCGSPELKGISGLRGLQLKEFICSGSQVSDLSPLKDMPLTLFECDSEALTDLSPLKGMKLRRVILNGTSISELTALEGMPIRELNISGTRVTDLSPLKRMPLTGLHVGGLQLKDLSPLKGMPLTSLSIYFTAVSDLSPLVGMPLKNLQCQNTKVQDLTPLSGMALEGLQCGHTNIDDLSPLKGMPLKLLDCRSTGINDLTPLKGMPLSYLHVAGTKITDLSPLRGMALDTLSCDQTPLTDLSPLKTISVDEFYFGSTGVTDLSPLEGKEFPSYLYFNGVYAADVSVLKSMRVKGLFLHVPLFDDAFKEVLDPQRIEFVNSHNSTKEFLSDLAARRTSALEFADSTAKRPLARRTDIVRAALEKLHGDQAMSLQTEINNGGIEEASVLLLKPRRYSKYYDLFPLMAFHKLKKLTVSGREEQWVDLSSLKHVPLEELTCRDEVAYVNSGVLKTIATLKTINGKPAAEYWEELPGKLKSATYPRAKGWKGTPAQQAFLDRVAKLPAVEQVEAVRGKLREVNPGFDGAVTHKVEAGAVVEFSFVTDHITKVWPVRAFPKLTKLSCAGTGESRGQLTTLKDLAGLRLTELNCQENRIADLSPLTGMPLARLIMPGTEVSDLRPLESSPLTSLNICYAPVSDLSPLRGTPLTYLNCGYTNISDLSPVAGMPLGYLSCFASRVPDLGPLAGSPIGTLLVDIRLFDASFEKQLRSLPLQQMYLFSGNGSVVPPTEYWKQVDARREAAFAFASETARLAAERQVDAVFKKLVELNTFNGQPRIGAMRHVLTNGTVTEATLALHNAQRGRAREWYRNASRDITPLMAFKQLRKLTLTGGPHFLDISAVRHLPLEELNCTDDIAFKNSGVLKEMTTLKRINGKAAAEYWRELSGLMKRSAKPQAGDWQPTEEQQAFIDRVAKLPAAEQLEAVRAKLKEVNPGFDGEVAHKIEAGAVVEFSFVTDHITKVWPVRAFPKIARLSCRASLPTGGRLATLAELTGLRLTFLECTGNDISDLSPLRGMPLNILWCGHLRVTDLSPLKGMPLQHLACGNTSIEDLSPLAGLPLKHLSIDATLVSDLTPLADLKLESLSLNGTRIANLSPLKKMKLVQLGIASTAVNDLTPLNGMPLSYMNLKQTAVTDLRPLVGMPLQKLLLQESMVTDLSVLEELPITELGLNVRLYDMQQQKLLRTLPLKGLGTTSFSPKDEFWKLMESRRAAASEFVRSTAKLSGKKRAEAVLNKLRQLQANPQFLRLGQKIEDGKIVEANLVLTSYSHDLTPLIAFTDLKRLTLSGGPDWLDISPVTQIPLEELTCEAAIVRMNSAALKTMTTLKTINGKPAAEYWKALPGKMKAGAK